MREWRNGSRAGFITSTYDIIHTWRCVRHRSWTNEQLAEAVRDSCSTAEVLRRLGLQAAGGSQAVLNKAISELKLDTSHFTGQQWNKGICWSREEYAATLTPLLRKGQRISRLRERLIASGLKEPKCELCEITEWQDKPAPLQVDHVDGDHLNNELENLRILCANCHMQTETWGFKNGRRRTVWIKGNINLAASSASGVTR